jgi:YbbR domain-containing protein
MKILNVLFKKLLMNPKVKIFSLLSALFLWFYIVTDSRYEHTLHVPIHIQNQPEGWILTYPIPSKAKVRFRGTGKDLLSLGYRDRRIVLDLEGKIQNTTFPITVNMIQGIPMGTGVTPIAIVEPDSVPIHLNQFAAKKVPINSNIHLDPMDGFTQVGNVRFEPDTIEISGPKIFVDQIDFVTTQEIRIQGVLKDIDGRILLEEPPQKTIQFLKSQVQFFADIQRIGERIISDIPVNVIQVPRGTRVTVVPSTLTLKLQGGVEVLSQMNIEDIEATINYRYRSRYRSQRIPATIHVPPEVSFTDVKPQFFELIVER